jgi:ATP-dependent Zn protease
MSSWLNTKFKEDSMTRVEISKARKLKKKDFNRTYLKKYCKFLGYTTLIAVGMIVFLHLWVGAANQNYDRLEQIRKNDPFYVKSN